MRIGLVVPGFSADADDWCIPALRNLVRQLAREDEVQLFALRYPYWRARYELFGAGVIALGGGRRHGLGSLGVWRRGLAELASEHRRRRFDVLHAFWATESGALTALAGRLLGIPSVVSLAGGELVGLRDIGYGGALVPTERLKVGLALRLAEVITAGSSYLLGMAKPWVGLHAPNRLRRAPLGVDLDLFRPGVPAQAAPPRMLQVASLSPVKDQATLLQAVALLQRSGQRFVLELIGSGRLEPELRALADRLGVSASVEFRGAIRHDQLPQVYRGASLFVLSSRHEAQGMSVLEAAASGLPVVGTRVGALPELAPDTATAVPVGDPEALAGAISRVLGDAPLGSSMGRAARERVVAEFGLEATVARFRDMYTRLSPRV